MWRNLRLIWAQQRRAWCFISNYDEVIDMKEWGIAAHRF
jgi:hypothetical protein